MRTPESKTRLPERVTKFTINELIAEAVKNLYAEKHQRATLGMDASVLHGTGYVRIRVATLITLLEASGERDALAAIPKEIAEAMRT